MSRGRQPSKPKKFPRRISCLNTHCSQFEGRVSGLPLRLRKVRPGDTGNFEEFHTGWVSYRMEKSGASVSHIPMICSLAQVQHGAVWRCVVFMAKTKQSSEVYQTTRQIQHLNAFGIVILRIRGSIGHVGRKCDKQLINHRQWYDTLSLCWFLPCFVGKFQFSLLALEGKTQPSENCWEKGNNNFFDAGRPCFSCCCTSQGLLPLCFMLPRRRLDSECIGC